MEDENVSRRVQVTWDNFRKKKTCIWGSHLTNIEIKESDYKLTL